MPGIIGLAGAWATPDAISAAIRSISHFSTYRADRMSPIDGLYLGQVWRCSREQANAWHRDADTGICVLINGTIIEHTDGHKRVFAPEILSFYLEDRLHPAEFDGSFLVVIADPLQNKLTIFNDRLGTLPCYYCSDPGCFAFAPEAKAIFSGTGTTPAWSEAGLVTFLTLGYCLANTTVFNAVHFLEPASRLIVNLATGRFQLSRYWRIQFDPSPRLRSRRAAEDALYEAILAGHRSVLCDPAERFTLLLSGGWDSRGILSTVNELDRKPSRSLSWGLTDGIPGSDPYLAAQLARQYQIEHHFAAYDTDAFIENAAHWSFLTELNTDNFGWYGEGTNVLLTQYLGQSDFVVAGDECWGFGAHVRNLTEAMAACHMPDPRSELLSACLASPTRESCRDIYVSEVEKVMNQCVNMDPDDRKDFLYLHGRVARFIFSLGYYKELAIEVRRPFLALRVLDLIQQVPKRLRFGKNLYISTLIRFFPEVSTVEKRSESSLPNWRRDLRQKPELSRYFRALLSTDSISQSRFAGFIDLQAVERMAGRFFHQEDRQPPKPRDLSARHGQRLQSLKQRITAHDDVRLALHLRKPVARQVKEFDLLRRLALLVLLDRNFAHFAATTPVRNPLRTEPP